MSIAAVASAALLVSGLTFFTGFGLGTLLVPLFALFLPLPAAVAAASLVHFGTGLLKLATLGRWVHWPMTLWFGLPAMAAAFLGARTLFWLAKVPPFFVYDLAGSPREVTLLKLVIAALMVGFGWIGGSGLPTSPRLNHHWLPAGGLLSGFFGGLSGNQGAFRVPFLLRARLDKEAFIATGAAMGLLVDVARLGVFAHRWSELGAAGGLRLVLPAVLAAMAGSLAATRFLGRVTLGGIRRAVGILLMGVALLLGSGLI